MEKYLKLSDVIEELDRLVRTKQIEIIHGDFENIEKHFEDMSKNNPLDLLVTTTFAEKQIRKRYDIICNKIKQWDKTKRMGDYADGYRNGLVMAEKQFRNLFKDGEGNELESKSSW